MSDRLDPAELAIVRLGSEAEVGKLLHRQATTDAVRIMLVSDLRPIVRAMAAGTAKQDDTRLMFVDDPDTYVRVSAVEGAKSDETRLRFANAAAPRSGRYDSLWQVRDAAAQTMESDQSRLSFVNDPSTSVRTTAVRTATSDEIRLAFYADSDIYVRQAAVSNMSSRKMLMLVLRNEPDPKVREVAVAALDSVIERSLGLK